MRIDFFSSLLILMIVALTTKWIALFGRVQEQVKYNFDSSTQSVFMDLAYAKEDENEDEESQSETLTSQNETSNKPDYSSSYSDSRSGLNSEELRLLRELSKRRDELNKAQDEIQMRENVLKATESKIEQKLQDLKSLQSQVAEAMKAYNDQEKGKIQSLVKIYESMKPKDAAKIFDELEMPVLLEIVTHMKEVKLSPIIASMQTHKATELSVELSKQKQVQWNR